MMLIFLLVLLALSVLFLGGIMHLLDRDHARRLREHRNRFVRCPACERLMHPDWIREAAGLCYDCHAEIFPERLNRPSATGPAVRGCAPGYN